jgi:hypothetical protein
MSIDKWSCFICNVVFRTKELLSHHLEVAVRHMYHDHLILQEEPILPDVPQEHRDQLAALHHFRCITEKVAEEQHHEGGTSFFSTDVTELDAASQRCLEGRVNRIDLPFGHDMPQTTVVSSSGKRPPVLFDPYISDASAYFFKSSDNPPPKRPFRPRPRARSPHDSESGGDDGYYVYDSTGGEEEMVRMWLVCSPCLLSCQQSSVLPVCYHVNRRLSVLCVYGALFA